jgi:hypothetical protein
MEAQTTLFERQPEKSELTRRIEELRARRSLNALVSEANVRWLEDLLQEKNGWLRAEEIAVASGGRVNERIARELASVSENILSAPGSPGYAHIGSLSLDEADRWLNAGEHQVKIMAERYARLRRNAHRRIG